jgi:hypothetical protein
MIGGNHDAVRVVNNAVKDGFGYGTLADFAMPVTNIVLRTEYC